MTNETLKESRESLLADIDKRVEDHILEPTNAELLKKLIRQADDIDEAMMIAALGTTYKRTGFHFDKRLEKLGKDIRYFKKNESLSFHTDENRPTHKLIIGDNYDALQNLLIEYKNRVSVIYIDPPYGKDSMGEFAQTNYENAITRDNLLSMLYPRLMLAKQLLADGGVIFCSIDDKNQAYVKCLFDEVFGENSFAATFLWKRTDTSPSLSNKVRKKMEYVLCYVRQNASSRKFVQGYVDGGDAPLLNAGNPLQDLCFPKGTVRFNIPDGSYSYEDGQSIEILNNVIVHNGVNTTDFIARGHFKWGQENLNEEIQDGTYFLIKSKKFSIRYQKSDKSLKTPSNIIDSGVGVSTNEEATSCLDALGFKGDFDYAKPTSLIEYLVLMAFWESKDAIILDFFAGSGTTGHAVLDLNEKDKGNRQFILCQLNEKTDTTPKGIAYDVTAKRLKRIMTGECYDGTKDFKWAQENLPYGDNLDVYEIAEVANDCAIEGKTPFDVIDETLYGQAKFETLREKIAWVCSNFAHTQQYLESYEEWEKRKRKLDHATRS